MNSKSIISAVAGLTLLAASFGVAAANDGGGGGGVIYCHGIPATIVGTLGNDILVGTAGPDVIAALSGDDSITGGPGDDLICAGPGRDKMIGGLGSDWLDGESGSDTASYETSPMGVTANLSTGMTPIDGFGLNDTLGSVENLTGSPNNDLLTGGVGANQLRGLSGDDSLQDVAFGDGDWGWGSLGADVCGMQVEACFP